MKGIHVSVWMINGELHYNGIFMYICPSLVCAKESFIQHITLLKAFHISKKEESTQQQNKMPLHPKCAKELFASGFVHFSLNVWFI